MGYALYRAYYAAGGTAGIPGTPLSMAQWRRINAIAAAILLATAALAIVWPRLWRHRRTRPFLLAFCWLAGVACVSHALIDVGQRLASLSGMLSIDYPFWRSVDRRAADLQDLLFNEPWFFVEGLLWAAIAWRAAVRQSPRRRWWIGSAVAATILSTTLGLLSAFGVIGKLIIG